MRGLFTATLLALAASCSAAAPDEADHAVPDISPTPDVGAAKDMELQNSDTPDGSVIEPELGPMVGSLEIGRCELAVGVGCTGEFDEAAAFVPLNASDEVRLVVGPQGSVMLIFMVRTQGISGGEPEDVTSPDNPVLELKLFHGNSEIANMRTRSGMPTRGDWQVTAAGLFVIVDGLEGSLVGESLRIEGDLEDKEGRQRRGEATFVAVQ